MSDYISREIAAYEREIAELRTALAAGMNGSFQKAKSERDAARQQVVDLWTTNADLLSERDAARAECERLRIDLECIPALEKENAEWKALCHKQAAEQAATIAGLTDQRDGLQKLLDNAKAVWAEQLAEKDATIAALREAIQAVLDTHAEQPNAGRYREHGWWQAKFKQKLAAARVALEGKTP